MNKKSSEAFLEEAIRLLVEHFGADLVSAAIRKQVNGNGVPENAPGSRKPTNRLSETSQSIAVTLENLREADPSKYDVLNTFYQNLRQKSTLPESDDIRQFALSIGLKSLFGRSRKEMVTALMRYLMEQPTLRIQEQVAKSVEISGKRRQEGFSVLADKLLGTRPERSQPNEESGLDVSGSK